MTQLEIEAIRKLPENYVADDTCSCLFNGLVIAMNAKLPALAYKDGKWGYMDAVIDEQTAHQLAKDHPRWKSKALWPDGETTEDEHDTEAQARAVCRLLKQDGMGGLQEVFPKKTWVEPPSHQPVPERNHYPDRSKDDKQPGTE